MAEDVIIVDIQEMNQVFPDRSAGRWCDTCNQNGNHHTDRHNSFAKAVKEAFIN